MVTDQLVIVRGGGDLATGVVYALRRAGFPVLVLESDHPSAIRRSVALCEAVYEGSATVEDLTVHLAHNLDEAEYLLFQDCLAIMVDPAGETISKIIDTEEKYDEWDTGLTTLAGGGRHLFLTAVVDAILAKKNLGTTRQMAPFVVALGPGFTAGADCDVVIETMRGHNLGRVIADGPALPNTGTPGLIAGHAADRVIHSPSAGVVRTRAEIGDLVQESQVIAQIVAGPAGGGTEDFSENESLRVCGSGPAGGLNAAENQEVSGEAPAENQKVSGDVPAETGKGSGEVLADVRAPFTGLLRGMIRDGFAVPEGYKIADIDPRAEEKQNCFTISDKARALGNAVVTEIIRFAAAKAVDER